MSGFCGLRLPRGKDCFVVVYYECLNCSRQPTCVKSPFSNKVYSKHYVQRDCAIYLFYPENIDNQCMSGDHYKHWRDYLYYGVTVRNV